eukprot:scaffold32953_cov64-Phaeocystis_antarctica.AAC.6
MVMVWARVPPAAAIVSRIIVSIAIVSIAHQSSRNQPQRQPLMPASAHVARPCAVRLSCRAWAKAPGLGLGLGLVRPRRDLGAWQAVSSRCGWARARGQVRSPARAAGAPAPVAFPPQPRSVPYEERLRCRVGMCTTSPQHRRPAPRWPSAVPSHPVDLRHGSAARLAPYAYRT